MMWNRRKLADLEGKYSAAAGTKKQIPQCLSNVKLAVQKAQAGKNIVEMVRMLCNRCVVIRR